MKFLVGDYYNQSSHQQSKKISRLFLEKIIFFRYLELNKDILLKISTSWAILNHSINMPTGITKWECAPHIAVRSMKSHEISRTARSFFQDFFKTYPKIIKYDFSSFSRLIWWIVYNIWAYYEWETLSQSFILVGIIQVRKQKKKERIKEDTNLWWQSQWPIIKFNFIEIFILNIFLSILFLFHNFVFYKMS